jgi:hypothetical protein
MARLFKIHAVNSDGSDAPQDATIRFEVIDPTTNKPFLGEDGLPSVVITLRPISPAKYRQVTRENTQQIPARKGQPPREETDWDGVQDDLVTYAVIDWIGLYGADDKPLQCVLDAKLGLPGDLKNELVQRAMQGEAVSADSFRPAL